MSRLMKRLVKEQIDSAFDSSFNGVYDMDHESEWLASKLNEPVKKVDDPSDPPMFQKSLQRYPENG